MTFGTVTGSRMIDNFKAKVRSVRWLDNEEELTIIQDPDAGMLAVNCTGFPYGSDAVVRVARIETI